MTKKKKEKKLDLPAAVKASKKIENEQPGVSGIPTNTKPAWNIAQRLWGIMTEVEYIEKKGFNDFHKYPYALEADVKEAVRRALVKYRVLFISSIPKQSKITVTGDRGKSQLLTSIEMEYHFINIDNPEDMIGGTYLGDGIDSGDKGLYKAYTGAIKYLLMDTFLIPTGTDPEGDTKVDKDFDKGIEQEPFPDNMKGHNPTVTPPAGVQKGATGLADPVWIREMKDLAKAKGLNTPQKVIDYLNTKVDDAGNHTWSLKILPRDRETVEKIIADLK